jgi:hypothetical protein
LENEEGVNSCNIQMSFQIIFPSSFFPLIFFYIEIKSKQEFFNKGANIISQIYILFFALSDVG